MANIVRRFRFLFGDDTSIYGILPTGELLWYPQAASAAGLDPGTSSASGKVVGTGWADFQHVFCGGNGIIYAIRTTGELLWYRDLARNGTWSWATGSGNQIGVGWHFAHVLSGGGGVIYAVASNGNLLFYKDLLRDGSNAPNGASGWSPASGSVIGTGWTVFRQIVSGDEGVLYAIRTDGTLAYYRDQSRDGTMGWAATTTIGSDWDQFTHVFPGAPGVLWACRASEFGGQLLRYQDTARDGSQAWTVSGPSASGWQVARLEGYAWPPSTRTTATLGFHLSAMQAGSGAVELVRLTGRGPRLGAAMTSGPAITCAFQGTGSNAGCSWPATFNYTVPASWAAGIYAARCTNGDGAVFDVPFVVSRPGSGARVAVIVNTNTWNAYNTWGGGSNYTGSGSVTLGFQRPNLHLLTAFWDHGSGTHMLRSEIWFIDWLRDQGIAFDLLTDADLEGETAAALASYRVIILDSHPEYWTSTQIATVKSWLAAGRNALLYLGGNAMYRPTTTVPAATAAGLRPQMITSPVEWDDAGWAAQDFEGHPMLGVPPRNLRGPSHGRGVRVLAPSHAFFAGTAVTTSSVLGTTGWNMAGSNAWGASGWETDCWITAPGSPATVLAKDEGADGQGASIVTFPTATSGFILGVGSLTFVGAMMADASLQAMVRNAINQALSW